MNTNVEDILKSISQLLLSIGILKEREKNIFDKLALYVKLLSEWENTHNLISRKQQQEDIWENIYDSLIILAQKECANSRNFFGEKDIVDVGTGGGFPGIPLCIICENKKFILIDSNRKKCSFLRHVKSVLKLDNISIINDNINNTEKFPYIVTKAAFSPKNIGLLGQALVPGGTLVIWGTEAIAPEFVPPLLTQQIILAQKTDYILPRGKRRALLFFRKHQ